MPRLGKAARWKWIPGWRKFLAQMWDAGNLYVDVSPPSPHPVQEMIMSYGPGQVANMVAFSAEFLPRLATEMKLSNQELQKKFSVFGLRRRTEPFGDEGNMINMTRFKFFMEAWNQNCRRLQMGYCRQEGASQLIVDNDVDTCPRTYDDFLAGAASAAGTSDESAIASPPPSTPPPTKRKAAPVEQTFDSPPPPPPVPATTPPTKKRKVRCTKKQEEEEECEVDDVQEALALSETFPHVPDSMDCSSYGCAAAPESEADDLLANLFTQFE